MVPIFTDVRHREFILDLVDDYLDLLNSTTINREGSQLPYGIEQADLQQGSGA